MASSRETELGEMMMAPSFQMGLVGMPSKEENLAGVTGLRNKRCCWLWAL